MEMGERSKMPTPPKSVAILKAEGKSHRSKKELTDREKLEKSLLTGKAFKERAEVKSNGYAHSEFKRVAALFKAMGKNDALFESTINRYCLLQAECYELNERNVEYSKMLVELREQVKEALKEMPSADKANFTLQYSKEISKILAMMAKSDTQLQAKRKMCLDIEKENGMTVASALRTIPPRQDNKADALLEALSDD